MKKLFVGSLAWGTDDNSLRTFFEQFGTVAKAEVVRERDSGRSRGFGFVEFENDAAADKAIAEGNEKELDGRNITVSESKPREPSDRPRRDNNRNGGNSFRQRNW